MRPRSFRPSALALLLALGLGACDTTEERPPRVVPADTTFILTYRVVPTAEYGAYEADAIRFTGADGRNGALGPVDLPWSINVTMSRNRDHIYSLESELTASGDVAGMTAQLFVDGEPVSQGTVAGQSGGLRATRTARAVYRFRP
ncbi:hypothetical protein [Rubrivirga marina]|uniref:hypothetical protein n=1 Tax=Rubrivirga marina TaxID=1196024 RepID=UPI000BA8F3A9|nr:hypothetical protein [Rubrivirga marina]